MQQSESTTKYVLSWNDQALDTYHDIIISLDYAMYNYNDTPTCGFCIALFESLNDKPRGGGAFYSLGYTPSDINDICNPEGYNGLESALYGIGFDVNGIFAKKTNRVDGLSATVKNSICLRNGIRNDYAFIKQSENLLYSRNLSLAQQLTANEQKINYNQIRIIFKDALTKLEIEGKKESDDDFKVIFQHDFPLMDQTSVKVGLFFTSLDQNTKFEVKSFNVAGFPSRYEKTRLFSSCTQTISTNRNLIGNTLPSYNEWIVANNEKGFRLYRSNSDFYVFKQNVISTNNFKILNYTDEYLFAKSNNSLIVYEYKGNSFIKQNTIRLPTEDDIMCCAGYGNTLVIGTTSNNEDFYVYKYDPNTFDIENIGNWYLFQTFNNGVTGQGYGKVVEMGEDYIFTPSSKDQVVSYKKDPDFGYYLHQTINKPNSAAISFGKTLSVDGRDLLIGAPYAQKTSFPNFGNGEVYHYYLSEETEEWTLIMEMGDYFRINSPAGNFGNSLKINKNTAIIGAPSESYFLSGSSEEPNVGRAYVFRKTEYGYFTQTAALAPLSSDVKSYTFFGSQVNTFQNLAVVGIPYTLDLKRGEIAIFNLDCVFDTLPLHLPIPINAIQLINLEGFVIDREDEDYMVHFQHPNPSILYNTTLSSAIAPFDISFSGIDLNVYGVDNWYWSISGDEEEEYTTQNVTVSYPLCGSYTIKLSATNQYGLGVETLTLNIASPTPTTTPTVTPTPSITPTITPTPTETPTNTPTQSITPSITPTETETPTPTPTPTETPTNTPTETETPTPTPTPTETPTNTPTETETPTPTPTVTPTPSSP
jgi:hypothetical protein